MIGQRAVPFGLPTNVRSIYYVGKGTAWAGDTPGRHRKPSQDVSDACQWLIDRGLVGDDEITDADGHMEESLGVVDVLDYIREQAAGIVLDPWSPNPVPTIVCEGRNDLALVRPIGVARRIRWVALGGMVGRGHLRRVGDTLPPDTPIGYVGDANRSGHDIERNAKRFLRARGWSGTWKRLLITQRRRRR